MRVFGSDLAVWIVVTCLATDFIYSGVSEVIVLGMVNHHHIDFYESDGIWRGSSPDWQNTLGSEVAGPF